MTDMSATASGAAVSSGSMPVTARPEPWLTTRALTNPLVLAALFTTLLAAILLFGLGGWEYYGAPLATRGYLPAHRLLRPSGPIGLTLGIAGVVAMLSTLPYAIRKHWKRLARLGSTKGWLEAHIFFGIVGPVLVTFHTSFKFNGLISAGYWLMMTVWASGFVGRYLYVRIPKTIRGVEISRADLEHRIGTLRAHLDAASLPAAAQREFDAFDAATMRADRRAPGALDLVLGEFRIRARLWLLRRQLLDAGVDLATVNDRVTLAAEHAAMARRLVHLQRTKRIFELWHVFHRPLVSAMFAIVAIHVGIALYFGYARFAW
jgi:hypothetical protein